MSAVPDNASASGASRARRSHPLDAVPVAAPDAHAKDAPEGGLFLGRPPSAPATRRDRFAQWLGLRAGQRVVLDARGADYWRLVDGERPLRAFVAELSARWGTPERETHDAVVVFTKTLMTRGLLLLRLPEHAAPAKTDSAARP